MEEKPGQGPSEPRPGRTRERINERMERVGDRVEESAEGLSAWVADLTDWVMAPPFLPQETRRHLFAARREALLAMRSVIDRSIARTEEAEHRSRGHKATKIEVE